MTIVFQIQEKVRKFAKSWENSHFLIAKLGKSQGSLQPRYQTTSASSGVTSSFRIALGSKAPPLTRIADYATQGGFNFKNCSL